MILKDTHTCEHHPERFTAWTDIAQEVVNGLSVAPLKSLHERQAPLTLQSTDCDLLAPPHERLTSPLAAPRMPPFDRHIVAPSDPARKGRHHIMQITDIKTYPVWVGHRNQCVVKVETDEGIYGLGEAGLSGRELAVKGAVDHYREWLIGKDPMRRGALWQEMYRSQYFEGGRVLSAAISALDIAFLRYRRQETQCARLSIAGRQTARLCALLCQHRRR